MNLRAVAARIIYQVVIDGKSLSDCLAAETKLLPRDKSFLQALCYGTCRWYHKLHLIAESLLEKPLKTKDQDIYCLLLVGLYQLSDMRVPAHAAISETVAAASVLKKIWAKGLVNAVLRNYQRQSDIVVNESQDIFKYSHPSWLIKKIQHDWPENWETILNENNQHPPFSLRVNQKHISREDYLKKLTDARVIPETTAGIILENAIDVAQLPGFSAGDISVQDGAAQLAAELLSLQSGQRILDACAAPGGKTAHILESENNLTVIALDHDNHRLNTIKENLNRLKLSATCITADAGDTKQWWDGVLFDRILLDAPCSASGVIRRHPDIKILRREIDIVKLSDEQARILDALWPLLKKDGILVYATCSIFPEENNRVVKNFLATHTDAIEEKISAPWGIACDIGRQILPGMHGFDGFYYTRLRKQ